MTNEQFHELVTVLHSISQSLKVMAQRGGTATAPVIASVAIADDRDLDSTWGDEEVRVTPRDWTGEPMKGRRMSECPPAFLDMLADTLDYFAKKNEASGAVTSSGKPKAQFDRKAAARARGWASRLRSGWKPVDMGGDDFEAPASFGNYTAPEDVDDLPF